MRLALQGLTRQTKCMKVQHPNSPTATADSVSAHSNNAADVLMALPAKAKPKTNSKTAQERALTHLIGSVEFGDWLIGERPKKPMASPAEKVGVIKVTASRQELLKTAETVLFEFLTLQQAMLEKAEKARRSH